MRVTTRQRKRVKKELQRKANEQLLQYYLSQLTEEERAVYDEIFHDHLSKLDAASSNQGPLPRD